jgi:uncharacterized membrane protein YhiD involved in acid resistance
MEFLQQLFGNLTTGMIRLAVAVGIIVAVGIFIVRPILDSTDHAVDSANKAFESSSFDTKAIEAQVNKAVEDVNNHVQIEVEHSFHATTVHGDPEKILHCVKKANGNVHRIERCAKRY